MTKLFLKCFIKDDFILFPNHAFFSFIPCLFFPRSIRPSLWVLGISQLLSVQLAGREEVHLPWASQQTRRSFPGTGRAQAGERAAGKPAGLYRTPLGAAHPNCPRHCKRGSPRHRSGTRVGGLGAPAGPWTAAWGDEPWSKTVSSPRTGTPAQPRHLWIQPNCSGSRSALAGTASPRSVVRFCSENASRSLSPSTTGTAWFKEIRFFSPQSQCPPSPNPSQTILPHQ